MTTIAITGSTGHLGRLAIAALKRRQPGASLIALARDPAKAADLGVPVRAFDYTSAEPAALKGVDVLVLISSNDFNDRAGQHRNAIAAAKAAGVGRIVYTSILKGLDSPLILAADHKETERALGASDLSATILRNGWYAENVTGSLAGSVAAGAMIGANTSGRVSYATRADYAEAIAVAVGAEHAGKTYELAGDTGLTMAEVAALVSARVGKPIPYNALPADAYAGILVSFGLPEGFAAVLADSDVQADKGALFDDSRTLSRLIGRPTTPMAEAVAAALG